MLKQRLQQKLLQKLSPQQIQMIKLLEIPAMQLEQRIKKELEENPVLEEGSHETAESSDAPGSETPGESTSDLSIEEYVNQENATPAYRLQSRNFSKDDKKEDIPFSVGDTFHDHLETQLGLRSLTEKQKQIGLYILGNIDEDGYLRRTPDAMVDDLAFLQNMEVSLEEVMDVLRIVQDFEPAGVGARDLQECLLLQLNTREDANAHSGLAYTIVKDYFQEFTRKHYDKIISRLGIDEDDLRDALEEIVKLNPKPGSGFSDPLNKSSEHIVPDFTLDYFDGEFQLNLNTRSIPELRLSRQYTEMLEAYMRSKNKNSQDQKDAINFVKQKLDAARWFIEAIKQRQNTLMVTMQAILDYQKDFFREGDETKLRPMILKDIADRTELDISTISRVANSKYIQTHFGIYSLKFFFSEGLQTEGGEEVSSREIKKILTDCIDGEDKRKPLTDDELAEILQKKGYHIARRTIAKYREQLDIPVARLRKSLH